jgi:lantibiotic modifying enzyme
MQPHPVLAPCDVAPLRAGWKPLLEDDLRRRAIDRAGEIASALESWISRNPDLSRTSLSSGGMGLAFFFLAYSEFDPSPRWRAHAVRHFERGIAAGWSSLSASLFGGVSGAAWAVHRLAEALGCSPGDALLDDVDHRLAAHVSRSPWRQDWDLVQGLVGVGFYGLERLPRESGQTILERVVDRLAEGAVSDDQGTSWFTAAPLLTEGQRTEAPGGWTNLGLAHGVPGILQILAGAAARDVRGPTAQSLLREAVRWVLARRLAPGSGSQFPSWISPGRPPKSTRLGWCYGDLGIAVSLLGAARWIGEASWENEARAIASDAALRPASEARVQDAGLCHGAAGIAHLLNRLYQSTGDEILGERARFWIEEALRLQKPGQGIAGYLHYFPESGKKPRWLTEPGILTGAAGIGLALLSACSDAAPGWDRFLLASIPEVRT